jgi:hypothetical protein
MRTLTLHGSNHRRLALIAAPLLVLLVTFAACRYVNKMRMGEAQQTANAVWKLAPGTRLVYELKYESDSYSDLQALYSSVADRDSRRVAPHVYRVTVEARVVLTAIQRNSASIVASYRFPDSRINTESEMGNMIDADQVRLELARETFCEIDKDGRIRSLRFDPSVSGATANFIRALLGAMQFARPEAAEATHWEIEEDDSSGHYIAQYDETAAIPPPSGQGQNALRTFRKTKLEYFRSTSDDERELPEAEKTILPEAAFDVTFDSDKGRIETVSGSETQTILIAGKIVGEARNKIQLILSTEDQAPQGEIASAVEDNVARRQAIDPMALSASPSERAQLTAIYRSQLGNDSIETVKTALYDIERGSSKLSYSEAYSKVKALIFLHPEVCAELGMVLRDADPTGPVVQLVAGALAAVGSDEAQEALIAAIKTRGGDTASVQPFLVALGAVKRPTLAAQVAVEELAWQGSGSDLENAAQLVLGVMAHNLKQRSPQRAAEIVERATAKLSAVSGAESELIALLGNSGVAEALPIVARFLDHPSPEIRGGAALALRFIDGEPVDEKLARVMTSDQYVSVRLQAETAFEFRNITQTTFEAYAMALRSDASASVRMRVMSNLWRNHDDYPEVIAVIERVAMNDPSKEVRSAAMRLVASR